MNPTIVTAESIEDVSLVKQTRFTFTSTLKIVIHAGPCMHCNEEIQPLLRGENYEYGDCNFDITQRDGMTTFSLSNCEGTTFDITVSASECAEALKFWVESDNEAVVIASREQLGYEALGERFDQCKIEPKQVRKDRHSEIDESSKGSDEKDRLKAKEEKKKAREEKKKELAERKKALDARKDARKKKAAIKAVEKEKKAEEKERKAAARAKVKADYENSSSSGWWAVINENEDKSHFCGCENKGDSNTVLIKNHKTKEYRFVCPEHANADIYTLDPDWQ